MILTRKRLHVDIFLTRRLSKFLAFCKFVTIILEPCISQLKPYVRFYCFNRGQVVWKPISATNVGMILRYDFITNDFFLHTSKC